jgi:FtsZ-interacting cell division protein ZipA
MKASRITWTTIAILLIGFVVPAWAGQERPSGDKDHPKQDNKQQARPAQQPQQSKQSPPRAQPQQRQAPQQQQAKESPRAQPQQRQAPQHKLRNSSARPSAGSRNTRYNSGPLPPRTRPRPSNMFNKLPGSSIGQGTGSRTTVPGSSAVAITATAFRTPASAATSVRSMDSASRVCRSWWLADFRASNTTATG